MVTLFLISLGASVHPARNEKEALNVYSLILVELCAFQAENIRYSQSTESSIHGRTADEIKNTNQSYLVVAY